MIGISPLLRSLITFRRIPMRIVVGTAVASALLGLGMIVMGQPLYVIALYVLLPWAPVMMFEGLWKVRHYHWIAIFGVVVLLQIGHVIEHIVQVGVLTFTDASVVCPPPVDSAASALRAIEAGLRSPDSRPTGMSASVIVQAGADGLARRNAAGDVIRTPPACGIFGQLDLEIVHLVWEMAGWILILLLFVQFSRNKWLWFALAWATFHTFEHLFISYTFFLDSSSVYEGTRQIWGTIADGSIVTAVPLGQEPADLNFYDVAGKFGLLAKNGLVGTFFPSLNQHLLTRPVLHLYYNALVTLPLLVAFLLEVRHLHDRYLRKVLPITSTQALTAATPELVYERYQPGQDIATEGEPARDYYIITTGKAAVMRSDAPRPASEVQAVEFFGEIDTPADGRRQATIRALTVVEVIRISRETFDSMVQRSRLSREAVADYLKRSEQPLPITR